VNRISAIILLLSSSNSEAVFERYKQLIISIFLHENANHLEVYDSNVMLILYIFLLSMIMMVGGGGDDGGCRLGRQQTVLLMFI